MNRERLAPRIVIAVAILSIIVAIAGFVITMVLNAFVFDEYDAYGEVPIPGTGSLELPAGEVTISFHTLTTGSSDTGIPVPELGLSINPPEGVPEPVVTESWSGTTSVNNDARVRVWVAQIPEAATYEIVTGGEVNGYISPRLAFGRDSSNSLLLWVFGALFVTGIGELFVGIALSRQAARRPRPLLTPPGIGSGPPMTAQPTYPETRSAGGYAPSDQGIRIEQIRTLAALRDSGALTDEEFESEKRRILDS
jgi:hypothetical protein